ncbi:gp53-like domain-containing protein [Sporomusa sp.]|uniref:gp53-like domain-containing protein n=1 Tax=Sporomusa sp. TaxID=2078658 RepID=UPI002C069A3F|nr:hypothetical protein [Sporomusa sp.]HWR09895.1 hypothetical protein [Sporomusa sp.]
MALDLTSPADTEYLSTAPGKIRENDRAIVNDKVVNAGKLQDLTVGNASGNIPVNNGTLNVGLNAEKLNGQPGSYYSPSTHVHSVATTTANGFMANTDKSKLDGIAAGAEKNQNAFGSVKVGTTTIQADAAADGLEMKAGTGITLTPDATNDAVTIAVTQDGHSHTAATTSAAGFISATDKVKLDGIAAGAEVNQHAFATIVAGGVSAAADAKQDTFTINAGAGITVTGDAANDACTIAVTTNGHTHTDATTSAAGFMAPAMVTKLNGIATGAQTNQNAFSNVLIGATTVAADSATDTLELLAGANITLTPDAANDRVTIAVSGKVPNAAAADTAAACTGNAATATTSGACTGNAVTATNATNHIAAASGAHMASAIASTATGGVAATNVQAAIAELDTEKQPKDATLTALAAVVTAANQLIYATGNDTFATTGLTAFARTLLDDANEAAALATLGAAPNASPVFTGTPTAPTAAAGTNNTQIATTSFVQSLVNTSGSGIVAASLTQNGYVKFANGLILQWGISTSGDNVTFPITFPNACLNVVAAAQTNGGFTVVWAFTMISAVIGQKDSKSTWVALGY